MNEKTLALGQILYARRPGSPESNCHLRAAAWRGETPVHGPDRAGPVSSTTSQAKIIDGR